MPNRILKETICTSETIDNLSVEAERFFYRLLVNCDDYGLMDARPRILRARCFPLRVDQISDDDIAGWLAELEEAQLIAGYRVGNHPYLELSTWAKHQQIRAQRAKYPQPSAGERCSFISAINCNQMNATELGCPRNPIQSESNPIGENTRVATRADADASAKEKPREDRALWDALKDAHGYEPSNSVGRGSWNKTIRLLRDSHVKPEEYPKLLDTCREVFPNLKEVTPAAVAKYVDMLRNHNPKRPGALSVIAPSVDDLRKAGAFS